MNRISTSNDVSVFIDSKKIDCLTECIVSDDSVDITMFGSEGVEPEDYFVKGKNNIKVYKGGSLIHSRVFNKGFSEVIYRVGSAVSIRLVFGDGEKTNTTVKKISEQLFKVEKILKKINNGTVRDYGFEIR